MIDPPRWTPKDLEEEVTEGPSEILRSFERFRGFLISLLVALLAAFSFGVILGSFCMGIFVSMKWIMEWIK